MALSVGSLIAFLKGDTKNFEKALKTAEKKAKEFAGNFEAIGMASAGVAGSLALVGAAAVKVASDFKEVQSAAEVAFGSPQAASGLEKWAEDVGEVMGRSKIQMMKFATEAQLLIDPMVGNKDAAAKMSKQISQLAVDLGSMNNVADDEALKALRSGISGEAEPLKRFGIVMNDTNLKAYALSHGLSGNVKEMSEAARVSLRLAFIMDKTKNAQGDAARTSDSFANQLKRAKGSVTDLANNLGRALEPAANAVLHAVNGLLGTLKSLDDTTIAWSAGIGAAVVGLTSMVAAFAATAAVLPKAIEVVKGMGAGFQLMRDGALKAAAAMGPIIMYSLAIAAAVAGVILVIGAMKQAWDANLFGIQDGLKAAGGWITRKWTDITNSLGKAWASFKEYAIKVLQGVLSGFATMVAKLIRAWAAFQDLIGESQDAMNANSLAADIEGWSKHIGTPEGWKELVADAKDTAGAIQQSISEVGHTTAQILGEVAKDVEKSFLTGLDVVKKIFGATGGDALNSSKPLTPTAPTTVDEQLKNAKKGDAAAKTPKAMTFGAETVTGKLASPEARTMNFAAGMLGDAVKNGVKGLSSVIEGAMQGAQVGGPLGAIVGALLGALTQTAEFQGLLDMIGGIIGTIGKVLTSIVPALQPLLGALELLLDSAFTALAPYFDFLAIVTEPLAAVIVALSGVLLSMTPFVKILGGVFSMIAILLMSQFVPQLGILFEAFKWAGVGMLELAKMIAPLWNSVVGALSSALRAIADIGFEIAGQQVKPFATLGGWANSLDNSKLSVTGLQEAQDNLRAMTYATAVEQAKLAAATEAQASAVHSATEAFTNVPRGLKLAEIRFASIQKTGLDEKTYQLKHPESIYQGEKAFGDDSGGMMNKSGGGTWQSFGGGDSATANAPGGDVKIEMTVNGFTDLEVATRKIIEIIRRERFRATGIPVGRRGGPI